MITYYGLGAGKRLNEIVIAGSHDAGITSGGANVQTQNVDIAGQAVAGVRLFDLRIAGKAMLLTSPQHTGKVMSLTAFHADGVLMDNKTKTRHVPAVGRDAEVVTTKLRGGAFGEGLTTMLRQARQFVIDQPEEFLILKFDKCTNWMLIAESCVLKLGDDIIYKGRGNLNMKKLSDLKRKVIVLFTAKGIEAVQATYGPGSGILGIKNLGSDGATYDHNYDGMQYYGKGGTSVTKPFKKLSQNQEKQAQLMKKGGDGNPFAMGMMYWTSTGIFESIEKRDDSAWTGTKATALQSTWKNGLEEAITSRLTNNINPALYSSAGALKTFMPNIVMIDFSDDRKCKTIRELNEVAATALVQAGL